MANVRAADSTVLGSHGQVETAREEIVRQYPQRKMAAAATLYAASEIDKEFFLTICTDFLTAARTAVAVKVEALLSVMYLLEPIGYLPRDFSGRDRASLETVIEYGDRLPERVQNFTLITLEQFSRDAQIELGKIHGATHWRWKTNRDSCDECAIKRNRVFPISQMQEDHPFCDCTSQLIWRKS